MRTTPYTTVSVDNVEKHVWEFDFEILSRLRDRHIEFDFRLRGNEFDNRREVHKLSATALYLPGFTGRT